MADNDEVISDAVVTVRPDTTGFRTKLEKQLASATKGVTVKVKVVPDATGLRDAVRVAVAKQQALTRQPVYKVKVVADAGGFLTTVRNELRKQKLLKQPEYKVKVTADVQQGAAGRGGGRGGPGGRGGAGGIDKELAKLYKRVRDFEEQVQQAEDRAYDTRYARFRDFHERVQRDELAAYREAERRRQAVEDAEKASLDRLAAEEKKAADARTKIRDKEARDRERILREGLKSRSKALEAPQLIDFGGRGVRPMNLLYGAVAALTPALFAMGTSALQAASSVAALGAAGTGAALGISALAISFGSISEVLKLRQSAQDSALVKTAKGVATSAADQANSLRDLANARRDEKAAYAAVHTARREAIRDLEDLRQAVRDLDNEYQSNRLSVREAEARELATNRNFFATALDRARARQDTMDARTRLSDTGLERKQKREDLARSVKSGVEGSDKVLQARERARDARDRRLDLAAAKTKQAAAGFDATSAAAAQLERKLAELSPAGREMYYWFDANDAKLKDLRRTIEQGTLPGFTTFLREVSAAPKGGKSTLQLAAQYAAELGGILGKYAGRFGKITTMGFFRKDMATIQKNNATALDTLGKAAERMLRPMLRIFAAASPLLVKFSDKLLDLATQFDTFIEKAEKNGSLTQWFDDTAEQARQWWRILSNAGRFLRDLFTATRPAGGSLVKDFADYMERLANWSSSAAGQKSIKDFFDTIADLPYAQIRDMLASLSELFLAKHVASWAAANPMFTAIGLLITSNPAMAMSLIRALTYFVETGARMVAANPELTALVLGMVGLAKINKATGGALFAVTGLDKLKEVLAGKFKVLDQFTGGGANTSVMNVRAAVVNIYGGGVAGGPGGAPGPGGTPGAPGAPGAKPGRFQPGSIGNLAAMTGFAVGAGLVSQIDTSGSSDFKKGLKSGVEGALGGAAVGTMLGGPIGAAIGAAIGGGIGLVLEGQAATQRIKATAQGREFFAREKVKGELGQMDQGVVARNVSAPALQDYIKARRESVAAAVEAERQLRGPAAARKLEIAETQKTAGALRNLLPYYGLAGDKVKAYANQVSGVNDLNYRLRQEQLQAQGALTSTGKKLDETGAKARNAAKDTATLTEKLDELTGERKIVLTVEGKATVIDDLEEIAVYQQLIRQNLQPTTSNINKQKKVFEKNRLASGGLVGGYSPYDKADNIPALLTAKEWVQPVSAVKYYGTDFMEAVRTRQFPRFAAGGPVEWPFPVKVATPKYDPESFSGPDALYMGAPVKGIGNVKGLGATIMAAVLDAKQKFPGLTVYSGYRAGSVTVTGNASYHGKRRAVDLPPSMALFEYLKQRWDGAIRELIYSPANGRQVWNGKPHMYSASVRKGHFDHVHLALAEGGQVPAKKFDTGGVLPPGYTLAFNGTGQNETVRTSRQEAVRQGPVRLDRRDITLLAAAVTATGAATVNMDGRRVAELTNQYNYLPSGV
jgi:hypothetical protein